MRLTRFGFNGVLFYLAMAGAFFASPYSNLFFLLLAFLTLQWVLGAVWTRSNMRGLTAEVLEVQPAPAGAAPVVRARVTAPGRVRFQIAVELDLGAAGRASAQADFVDGEAVVEVLVPPLARGVYRLDRAVVRSTYPLGLFSSRRPIEAAGELIVYPAPAEIVGARSGAQALAEVLGTHAGAGDLQPTGLRDHREGDELRDIHWRASARRGTLVVREWEGGGGQGLEVLIDRRCEPEALEEALSIVSAIVGLARDNKEVLAVHSQDLSATYGEGHRPWREALRFLAGADALGPDGPAPPLVSPSVTRLPRVATHAG